MRFGVLEHIGLSLVAPACQCPSISRWKKVVWARVAICAAGSLFDFLCFVLFSGERDWGVYVISSCTQRFSLCVARKINVFPISILVCEEASISTVSAFISLASLPSLPVRINATGETSGQLLSERLPNRTGLCASLQYPSEWKDPSPLELSGAFPLSSLQRVIACVWSGSVCGLIG